MLWSLPILPMTHREDSLSGITCRNFRKSSPPKQHMVDELERNTPPYIVLDSEFELSREPNDSSKSSGVTLLDRYIHDNYQPSETFGTMLSGRATVL
jgi:hypothetical protein